MTYDDLQLLREFRAEIPAPDEETRRRIYAYATSEPPGRWQGATRRLSLPPLRLRFAVPAVAVICAAVAAVVMLTGPASPPGQSGSAGQFLLVPPATLAQPLGPSAPQVSLADAPSALGGPVTLPNSSLASSANVGTVWTVNYGGDNAVVAIAFPQAGLIVEYERPVQTPPTIYQTLAQEHPNSFSDTDLNGVPGLAIRQNSDQTGANFGAIEFVVGGTQIVVMGHYDEAALAAVARSIILQSG